MFELFKKKENIVIEEVHDTANEQILDEDFDDKNEQLIIKPIEPIKSKKEEYITTQCIEMGMDIKHDVEIASKAFFQSKNLERAKAYNLLYHFMFSLEKYQIDQIRDMDYLEFKEKEEQIYTRLKTGFAQYLSKGSPLNEEIRRSVDLVFSDIKKLPSKAHRYWYYKIYIWQEANKVKD